MAQDIVLDVGGEPVGSLQAFRGLDVEADVTTRGAGPHPKKHVAAVRWTPGVVTLGGGMGRAMQAWIAETLDRGTASRGGGVSGDGWSVAFSGARLSAVGFPALDAASREPALMNVEIAARQVRWGEGGGVAAPAPDRGRDWLASAFRVEIGDLPCQRVARVGGFTWTCAADGSVTVPDIDLAISRADLPAWEAAARRWFVDRDHRDKHEMAGRILLLSPAGATLATVELTHVGLRGFSREDPAGDGGTFSVRLYAERIAFTA